MNVKNAIKIMSLIDIFRPIAGDLLALSSGCMINNWADASDERQMNGSRGGCRGESDQRKIVIAPAMTSAGRARCALHEIVAGAVGENETSEA